MNDIVSYQGTEIATATQVVAHVHRVQEIMKSVMKKDVHYGIIPGTEKNTLYKPGAELLCMSFHIAPTYQVVEDRFDDGVRYRVTCSGVHQGSGRVVADGLGSCSSMEEKYKWCKTYNKKEFEATPIDRRRMNYGYNRQKREEYEVMQVRVETADIENTLLKMASKRALIAMTLNALAASDIFAQDLEDLSKKVIDMMNEDDEGGGEKRATVNSKSGKDKAAPKKEPADAKDSTAAKETNGADKESPPASDGMLKLIRAKATAIKVDEPTLLRCHKLEKLEGITVAAGNAIIKSLESGPDAYAL